MERSILKVDGMSCQHCAMTVKKVLEALPGVSSAAVDLNAKTVTVDHDNALVTLEKIKSVIEDSGYDVIES